jgi:indolepyruvate ferredoxin oxidoreductase alpha subunit
LIAAGFTYQKLADLLGGTIPASSRILRLGTFFPLPVERILSFLGQVEATLVLEETSPLVERAVREIAQGSRLTAPIYGRDSEHIPATGELFSPDIAAALNRFLPGVALSTAGEQSRPRPSRERLCAGCPYVPTFDALTAIMERRGGRDAFIVVGDPGCMVRAQMPPYELMDVKHSLGSAIGMATGVAIAQSHTDKRLIALCGDSGFLHSGFNGLMDAARVGVRMLVLILDNGTTALSGQQPHPGSQIDSRGRPRQGVNLAGLAHEAGAGMVHTVDLDGGEDIVAAVEAGLDFEGLAVIVARGQCIL